MSNRWDDPVEWNAYLAEGNATQPRKRVSADVVLHDASGRLLLVDPAYKPDWDLPGGMAEANEAPRAAAERELREELGLRRKVAALLCVDWVPPHGPWDDSLAFVFNGGLLSEEEHSGLVLPAGELRALRFFDLEEVERLVRPRLWRRLELVLGHVEATSPLYLEDGRPVGSQPQNETVECSIGMRLRRPFT